jgi:Carboxypeptidase regulatory-like domain/TonB-dependent Receptor Plug Domain
MSNIRNKRWAGMLLIVWAMIFAASTAMAQVDTGTILGTVKDPTGAVIPNAKVTIVNQGTGETIISMTRSDGTYIVTPLKIASYRISVEVAGFKKEENTAFELNIQQQAVVDFVLQAGATSETVQVTSSAPLLQTQSAVVGQVIGAQTVENMPLNGRDWTMLATLTPGVTQPQQGARAGNQFAANGTRPAQNDYLLDGIDNNSNDVDFLSGEADVVKPPVDAIQEFNIQTNNFSAEFGRAGGAIVNATIKSGANGFHGAAWEFFRNDALDANAYFSDPATQRKPELRQNQFGAAAGGRIIKDRTFWFADYEGTQTHSGQLQSGIWVPTTPQVSSGFTNFADLLNASGTFSRTDALGRSFSNGQIFDPATTRPVTAGQVDPVTGIMATSNGYVREAFVNNQLPAGRLDTNAIKLLQLFPAQNLPGVENNYQTTTVNTLGQTTFDIRIDQHFDEHNQMFGRYSYINNTQHVPPPFGGVADGGGYGDGTQKWDVYGVAVSYTHVFTPTLINEVRFGYGQEHTTRLPSTADTLGIPASFGIGGVPQFAGNGGLPYMSLGNVHNLGGSEWLPGDRYSDTTQLTENLTKVYKSHTFKGGVEFQYLYFPWLAPPESKGSFDFDGRYASIPNQTDNLAGTAQFLLSPIAASVPGGVNNSGGSDQVQASNYGYLHSNRNYYGFYFQDDWKASPRLTLNLGLRWEHFGQVGDTDGAQANFVPGVPNSTAQFIMTSANKTKTPVSASFTQDLVKDGIQLVYTNQYGTGLGISQKTNFGPRVGASYQVTPKLVGRVGFGIFYGAFENRGGYPSLGYNYPFEYVLAFQDSSNGGVGSVSPTIFPDGSYGTLENGLSGISLNPTNVSGNGLVFRGVQLHYQTPYTEGFNLMLQYSLTPQDSIQAGYVGSVGRHLEAFAGTNHPTQILPPGTPITPYIAFPDFAADASYDITAGSTSYNSLQTKYERRFSHGFNMLAGYTWQKTLTDAGDLLSNGGVGGFRAPQIAGISFDRGLASFNINHSFVASGTYQLPFGQGKAFLGNLHGPGELLLGGWIANGILTLNSGPPQAIGCQTTTTADLGCYADTVSGVGKYRSGGPAHYYNPAAFTDPPVATTSGTSDLAPLGGSNTQVNGPGFRDLDFSIFKEFKVTETTRLQFRAESFNLTNTPSFNLPSNTNYRDTVNFGESTSTRSNPREIQFALKYYW